MYHIEIPVHSSFLQRNNTLQFTSWPMIFETTLFISILLGAVFIFLFISNTQKPISPAPQKTSSFEEATCASKSPTMETVQIRVGKEKYIWEMASPVKGEDVYARLDIELEIPEEQVRNIMQGGKKIKKDTIITKKLIVNLVKKKKATPPQSAPKVESKPVTFNFDFSILWKPLTALSNFFGATCNSYDSNATSSAQCEASILQTSLLLRAAADRLNAEAANISSNPEKYQELLSQLPELGKTLIQLGSGLQGKSKPLVEQPAKKEEKTVEEQADELFDELLDEIEPVESLNIQDTKTAVAKASPAAPSTGAPNLMDMMQSLMKPPADNPNGAPPANNLLNMLMKNKGAAPAKPKSQSPDGWKKGLRPQMISQTARIFYQDMEVMKNMKLSLSPTYLQGSSNVKKETLKKMLSKGSQI